MDEQSSGVHCGLLTVVPRSAHRQRKYHVCTPQLAKVEFEAFHSHLFFFLEL